MQPNIALTYNSQQGNSTLGVGWSLSGLSSIYRCNGTYAQDGAGAPIALSTTDGLCLDGRRLRLTSGTYGQAASTYQTEIADFSNVTAYGTAGNGPAYFIVKDRNGRSYQYGNGGNSQVLASGTSTALSWMLNSVSDPAGNTMTISYNAATGAAVPNVISWTTSGYGSTSYNYTMTFGYGANVAQSSQYGYVAGTPVVNTNLLSSITAAYSGTTVKKYVLSYQGSPTTGRDELTTVQECADTGATNCLAPTTITYQAGASGTSTISTNVSLGSGVNWYFANYDLNGDGYKDLIYQVGTTWYVAFGSATGFGSAVNTGISTSAYLMAQFMLPGDLLGTGKDGLLAKNGNTWWYYTWNGSAFGGVNTTITYDTSASSFALADTNGDGLPDLVSLDVVAGSSATVYTRLNTGSGSSVSFGAATPAYTLSNATITQGSLIIPDMQQAGTLRSFDFNGDGNQDLAMILTLKKLTGGNTWTTYELLGAGATFSASVLPNAPSGGVPPLFVQWNNDACTDYVSASTLVISACNGNAGATLNLGYTPLTTMDWDGDGRSDLVYGSGSTLSVQLSTGQGLGATIPTSVPWNTAAAYRPLDVNADGLDDLAAWSGATLAYFPHNGAGQPPDLVTSIKDGYGNSVSPSYVSVAQTTNVHYFNLNDAVYPYENYLGPLYVASLATFNDPSSGSGATYQQTYYYGGAWINLQGRGFAGFGNVQLQDSRNGIWRTRGYGRAFPYAGMYAGENTTQNNTSSTLLGSVTPTLTATTLSSTLHQERYSPYVSNVIRQDYELGSSQNRLVTTTSRNYSYDSYGNATEIKTTVTDNDSGSPYYLQSWTTDVVNTTDISVNPSGDLADWCLSLLDETQVTYTTTPATSTVVRTQTYTPDTPSACRIKTIVTEPTANGGIYKVTETLGFDSFGNVNSDSVAGANMTAARSASADWGTTGQFPMTVTDPSGAKTTFDYNFSYGLRSSVKDPNGLTTTWQYGDGFGRKTQEKRPDNTNTTWSYGLCSGCDPKPRMVVAEVPHDTAGNILTATTYYFDLVDRPIYALSTLLDGTNSWTFLRAYDSLGRVHSETFPFRNTGSSLGDQIYSYDPLNRILQIQRPISATNSTLQSTMYEYAGRTTTVKDPQTFATTTINDVNGWRRKTTDAYGYTLTFDYDPAGSQINVTDSSSNNLWSGTYQYGTAPFLVGETDMDRGTWSYTVDALGERAGWRDPKSQSFSQSFDALSRPLTRTEPDLFTQWTWGSTPASYNVGRLQSVCTGTGSNPTTCTASGYSEGESYDSLGRLYQRAISIPSAGTFTYTWLYNATTGLLDTLTYPVSTSSKALVLKYAYQNGFLQSITDALDSPNVMVWQANAMNPAGQITQETLGNGIVTNRNFDGVTHWLGSVQSGVGGGTGVENLGFLYDLVGNVTQRQDNNHSLTENIYYDNLYRFSYSNLNGTQNLSVTYDLNGNITSRSDVASGATWTYDPVRKHAVTQAGSSSFSYAYDANGNMSSRQGLTVTWSSYNYPLSVSAGSGSTAENVSFAYGPNRQRWQQNYTGNSTTETTDYVGGLLEIVAAGGVADYRHYIYAGSEPVAVYSRKSTGVNTFSYLLSDHQGSIASITNSSGAAVVGESFTPFGNRRNPTTWSGAASNADLTASAGVTRQGYTSQTALGSWMGLNHMNGRVQDAITGRFISADPIGTSMDDTQSWNRYSYVTNNPLTFTDPTGFTENKQTPTDCELQHCETIDVGHDIGSLDLIPGGLQNVTVSTFFGTKFSEPASGGMATVTVTSPKKINPRQESASLSRMHSISRCKGTRVRVRFRGPPSLRDVRIPRMALRIMTAAIRLRDQ